MITMLITGYYKVPDYTKTVLQIAGTSDKIITTPESLVIVDQNETNFVTKSDPQEAARSSNETVEPALQNEGRITNRKQNLVGVQTAEESKGVWERLGNSNITFYFSKDFVTFSFRSAKLWLNQQENKGLKLTLIVLVGCIIAMFWYFSAQVIGQVIFSWFYSLLKTM
jgi:hypothetical protein